MTPAGIAKLALALSGIIVFLLGIRTGLDVVRWTGVGLVVVAWLLRFVGEKGKVLSPNDSSEEA